MMRILIDTNIFLDLFLARHPFAADAVTCGTHKLMGGLKAMFLLLPLSMCTM